MARWQPNASERLAVAALDLFAERGYEDTTVIHIAEGAGLTKSTFFRHFADKREVLFGGDTMTGLLAGGIAAAPVTATPLEAVAHALDAAGREAFTPERREFSARRQAGIRRAPGTAGTRGAEGPRPHRGDDRCAQVPRCARPARARGRRVGRARPENRLLALEGPGQRRVR